MRLCIGTAKGIVILDPARGAIPLMVLADPWAVWCMAQDAVDPNLLYAGSTEHIRGQGMVSRSVDGGRTWTDVTPTLGREEEVWSVAASPAVKDCVYVGTSHARLFRSEDRGRLFKECDGFLKIPGRDRWTFPPPPHIPHVRSIAFDPHEPSTMYVGVEEGGVFRSRDGGSTFETLNDGIYEDIHTVAVDPRDSRRLYATTGDGFYLSLNAGRSWDAVTDGLTRHYTIPLLVSPPDRDDIFTPISTEQNFGRGMVMRLKPDPSNGGFFAVCNDGAVIRASTDGSSL